jgi:Tfp pilus assembly protein PilV
MRPVRRPGFSLMEVLLATSILLACLVVLSQMATVGRQHAEDAESLTVAQLLCQAKLNEVLIGAQPLADQAPTAIPEVPGWTYEVQVQSLGQYDLAAVRVTVAPEQTDGPARGRGKRASLLRWMHAPDFESQSRSSPFSQPAESSEAATAVESATWGGDGWDQ